MPDLTLLHDAILKGDSKTAKDMTQQALAAGVAPLQLVQEFMMPAMAEVGRRFECSEYFVPDLLMAARAMKVSLDLLRPLLAASGVASAGRVVIGTVQGDMHDIGKNLVAAMLEGGGFEVFDLGVNVAPQRFVTAVQEKNAQIAALSALLTTTMPAMKSTIETLTRSGLRSKIKILVGGAPLTQKYAQEIGADGYSDSAAAAVAIARQALAVS